MRFFLYAENGKNTDPMMTMYFNPIQDQTEALSFSRKTLEEANLSHKQILSYSDLKVWDSWS